MSKSNNNHSSPFPACCRANTAASPANHHSMAASAPTISTNPNLITSVYHTDLGLLALTWSRNPLGRSLHLHLHNPSAAADNNNNLSPSSSSGPYFHLHLKPFTFWNKKGSKKLNTNTTTAKTIQIFWDLSKAKFGTRTEPQSGYYIAAVVDGAMTLLAGDSPDEAYAKTRASKPGRSQLMVLRREHVYGINKMYTTKTSFGGKSRDISVDCRVGGGGDDQKLCFSVDGKRVLQIKHLKWKFRGNERIEVDGVYIQISWDVYNWLFEDDGNGYALFMFKFEKLGFEGEEEDDNDEGNPLNDDKNGWSQQSCGFGFEKKKMMRKSLLRTARSSLASTSSSSMSSASSSGCSSVMEWASVEENELKGPSGFSLLVYAWKS